MITNSFHFLQSDTITTIEKCLSFYRQQKELVTLENDIKIDKICQKKQSTGNLSAIKGNKNTFYQPS